MLRILHLEDRREDSLLVERALVREGLKVAITVAGDRSEFVSELETKTFDLILADNGLPGFSGLEALKMVRSKFPGMGFISLSGSADQKQIRETLNAGATTYVLKDHPWQIVLAVRREQEKLLLMESNKGMSKLVTAVQELSLARDLTGIMLIVRRAARELTGADGATFVLREGDLCHYADEDAIGPLWKGQRFPLASCISGWVMQHRQPVILHDIYADPRIPADAYRSTFVKSLAMVPIRTDAPLGAIGNYWAASHQPTAQEVTLLQALANTAAVAMENVRIYSELEQRVKDRTAELEIANRELESFSCAVSHDLSAPLRSISGFAEIMLEECAMTLPPEGKEYLSLVMANALRMRELIENLLRLSKIAGTELTREAVDLSAMATAILNRFSSSALERKVEVCVAPGMTVEADPGLLSIVLENLLANAWKYTSKCEHAHIEFSFRHRADGPPIYCIRDNGAGFDMQSAAKLFQPFQRLHSQKDFSGSGVGLTTVQRIVLRHGGRIWAESEVDKGAAFYFTLSPEKC